jgi:hypothetical protein
MIPCAARTTRTTMLFGSHSKLYVSQAAVKSICNSAYLRLFNYIALAFFRICWESDTANFFSFCHNRTSYNSIAKVLQAINIRVLHQTSREMRGITVLCSAHATHRRCSTPPFRKSMKLCTAPALSRVTNMCLPVMFPAKQG